MALKVVIFSIDDVIIPNINNNNDEEYKVNISIEIKKLFSFLKRKDIKTVFLTTRNANIQLNGIFGYSSLDEFLKKKYPESDHYCQELDNNMPSKQSGKALAYVANKLGVSKNEIIYVGRSDADLRAATNGQVLFLNATWYNPIHDYGFLFDTPKDIAKFIDIFCLKEYCWGWHGISGTAQYYALAPFSTYKPDFRLYSSDARDAAKMHLGTPDFWVKYLASSIYFSGISNNAKFITTYVGHDSNNPYGLSNLMENELKGLSVSFKGKYLKDLFVRNKTAVKSQTARKEKRYIDILNQLNTVNINPLPTKVLSTNEKYVKNPIKKGTKILVIDDFCTEGNSLETARLYLEKLGAEVVCISWLKTINTNVNIYSINSDFNPISQNHFKDNEVVKIDELAYSSNISEEQAPAELTAKIEAYSRWDWTN